MIFKPIVVFLQPSDTVSLFLFVCFYDMLNTSYYPIYLSRFCSFSKLLSTAMRLPSFRANIYYIFTRNVTRYAVSPGLGQLKMFRILVVKGAYFMLQLRQLILLRLSPPPPPVILHTSHYPASVDIAGATLETSGHWTRGHYPLSPLPRSETTVNRIYFDRPVKWCGACSSGTITIVPSCYIISDIVHTIWDVT